MEERKQGQIGCRMPGRTIGGTRPSNATVKKKNELGPPQLLLGLGLLAFDLPTSAGADGMAPTTEIRK